VPALMLKSVARHLHEFEDVRRHAMLSSCRPALLAFYVLPLLRVCTSLLGENAMFMPP